MWRSTFVPETIFRRSLRLKQTDRTCWTIQTHSDELMITWARSRTSVRLTKISSFGLGLSHDKPIVHSGFNSAAKIIYHRTFSNVSSIKQETAALKNPCFFCTHWELTYAVLQEKSTHIHGLYSKYTLKEYVDDLFNTEAVGFCWVDIQ